MRKKDWITAGKQLLIEKGTNFTIEEISKKLSRKRENFYYHFTDKDDFFDTIADELTAKGHAYLKECKKLDYKESLQLLTTGEYKEWYAFYIHLSRFSSIPAITRAKEEIDKVREALYNDKWISYYELEAYPKELVLELYRTLRDAWMLKVDTNNFDVNELIIFYGEKVKLIKTLIGFRAA